ncbi:hypothetical protein Patl1_27565 [Pistacia atlantica]|uniref:Uncharacterized protein n=1 Tax=Pistacia atlantica TaxID=434234 RepID=A0ACC1BCC0_9ROSI|nr:hypothetical protein Patl1_27565 [Pistacia atlantica]
MELSSYPTIIGWLEDAAYFAAIDVAVRSGFPLLVSGVPPDAFSVTGQLWDSFIDRMFFVGSESSSSNLKFLRRFVIIFVGFSLDFNRNGNRFSPSHTVDDKAFSTLVFQFCLLMRLYKCEDDKANLMQSSEPSERLVRLSDDVGAGFISGHSSQPASASELNVDSPLYDWNSMEKDGFSWWIRRLKRAQIYMINSGLTTLEDLLAFGLFHLNQRLQWLEDGRLDSAIHIKL